MDATQAISDSILESDEEEHEEENRNKRGRPLAKLCILKNPHIPETELPLFLGDNILGRDPNICTLSLGASSVSKQHATICISVYRRRGVHSDVDIEALVWDLGSMNGTRKGRLKLTPNVRYALSEGDSLVFADIPCQFVGCWGVSPQDGMKTPGFRRSGVKGLLSDALDENSDTSSKNSVNGGEKAKKAPVRGSCLSFEQTPTQPDGSLVPESDSDLDSEGDGGGGRQHETQVSDSDSHKSSPNSSAFLSPPNKIVPESEDEDPITPLSSSRSTRHVSFSTEKTDVYMERNKSPAFVENSDEEDKRAAQGGTNSKEIDQHVKQKNNVSFTGEDASPVSTPEVSRGAIPEFNMDSDTDVEGEEVAVPPRPLSLNTSQHADQPPHTVHFDMDSDTDIDEEDEKISDGPSKTSSDETTKPSHVASDIRPEGITMDSDTDVDADVAVAVSDEVITAKTSSCQDAHTADSASSVQPKDLHLDSDTDVDEEDEGDCRMKNNSSKTNKACIKSDVKLVVPKCIPAAPQNLHPDTDASNEVVCVLAAGGPSVASAVASCVTAAAGADLDILSDSDIEKEDDCLLVIPLTVIDLSVVPGKTSEALESDSDEDTDVDEPCMPLAEDIPADLKVDSDTEVEDEEGNIGEAGEDQIPDLQREHTVGSLVPALQNCSTPVQVSEEIEDMETQAFTISSSGAFICAEAYALKPAVLSSLSDSQEDEDYAVAETQSFVLQNRDLQADMDPDTASASESKAADRSSRGDSFQLGLSDSSHLQSHSRALAMESTQAFVSAEAGVNLEDTQAYEAISNLEATQVYEEDEETVRDSEASEKEGCINLAFEATQAFISQPYSDSKEDSDEAKRQNAAMTDITDLTDHSSTLAMAETQPVPSFEEEQSLETNNPTCSVQHVESRILNATEEKKAAQPQQKHLSVAETQPMCTSDNEEFYDEDFSTPSQLKEKQAQPNTCSALSLAETQPMNVDETQPVVLSENDEEDSMPLLRKRKAKQLHIEEEVSQKLTHSGVYTAETQPIVVSEDDDDDDNDSMPGPRKRKEKPLQLEDETQSLVNSEVSAVESQPLATCEGEQSVQEDFILQSNKRKARPLQLEEEQTQPLISSEVSGITTQVEDGGEENDSEILVPRKRKAKQLHLEEEETQQLMSSELSIVETQPICEGEEVDMMAGPLIETKPLQHDEEQTQPVTTEVSDVDRCDHEGSIIAKQHNLKEEELQLLNSEVSPGENLFKTKAAETSEQSASNSRQTRARLREKDEEAECSAPPKRQTRRESKTLPSTRGGRGKAMTHHDNGEEEVKQSKQTGGRKSTRQQEDKSKIIVNKSLIKERKRGHLEKEGDTAEFREEKREMTENERIETGVRTRKRKEMEKEKMNEELQNEGKANEKQDHDLEEVGGDGEKKQGLKKEREKNEQMEIKGRSEESLETAGREREERRKRGKKEQEHQVRLEKEKLPEVSQEKDEEGKQNVLARGRRSTRKTAQCTTEPEQNSAVSASDDFPARRTRSRSNSSNSVSSERSVSGINTQNSRGRGAKRSSMTLQPLVIRSSRRMMPAAGPTGQDSEDERFRSNSSSSEISTCSASSQNRARGGRWQGRGRKAYSDHHVVAPVMIDIDQHPTGKGGKKEMAEGTSSEVLPTDNKKKADVQQIGTSRGQQQVNANDKGLSCQEKEEKSLLPRRNARNRGQNTVQTENVEEPVVPPVRDGYDARNKRKGRKSELEVNTKADGSNVFKEKALKTTTEGKNEQKEETPVQVRRTSRVSSAQVKKKAKESPPEEEVEDGENMEVNAAEKKTKGRTSVVQKNQKEQKKIRTSASSTKQDTNESSKEPHTPTSTVSRKRQASSDSSPVAKTPRSSSSSPAGISRLRAGSQSYKVLFTGVVDETGERVLARLGGSMAKGVADMNCLVTDKVRRTVKFLCAVAKGIPVVTPDWLEKSGEAGSFLAPNDFVVKDPEQEKKFSFCLQESLRISRSQPLLQGYEIHVTKSVKPEPVHMKDIISCSGATFLPRMPSSHKPQTVVISCEEDWRLCGPAVSASLPVVTAEFILTGILHQKLDFQTHALSSTTTASSQPAEDRGRTRRKT